MNERIRELHNLACRIDMEQHPGAIPDGERIQQKFAQLIVRECIREIGYKSVELLDIDFYPHYQERLKKHFGVEE